MATILKYTNEDPASMFDDNSRVALEILKQLIQEQTFLNDLQTMFIKLYLEGLDEDAIELQIIESFPKLARKIKDVNWYNKHVGIDSFKEILRRYFLIKGIEEI